LKRGLIILKKVISIIICLGIVVAFYFLLKTSNSSDPKVAKTEPSSLLTPSLYEVMKPTDNTFFIEKRNTFTYNEKSLQYLLVFPVSYTQTTDRWPLILFLHGSSERGQDLNLVKNYGPSWLAEQREGFPFVVLAPQCPQEEEWADNPDILVALLDDIFKKYRIDQDRVYLTGTSMGGKGTWYLASCHPEYFAAIAPLAAKPSIPDAWKKQFISMPIWAFHGGRDPICPLKDDEAMINALRMQGGAPRLTILPDQGHYIAGIYKNSELYDWFLTNIRQH